MSDSSKAVLELMQELPCSRTTKFPAPLPTNAIFKGSAEKSFDFEHSTKCYSGRTTIGWKTLPDEAFTYYGW